MAKKLKVGVIGLGSMGSTHLDIYSQISEVEVVAVADPNKNRLDGSSRAEGNISGQAQGSVAEIEAKKYLDGMDLIDNPDIALVDICVGTNLHFVFVEAERVVGEIARERFAGEGVVEALALERTQLGCAAQLLHLLGLLDVRCDDSRCAVVEHHRRLVRRRGDGAHQRRQPHRGVGAAHPRNLAAIQRNVLGVYENKVESAVAKHFRPERGRRNDQCPENRPAVMQRFF